MNKPNHSLFLMAGFLTVGVIPGCDKGIIMLRSIGSVTFLALLMAGCGGGSGGGASSPPPPLATYTVGGTVTGLGGPGLVLNSNFGGDLAVSASGPFTFSTRLPVGSVFNVAVKIEPTSSPPQDCQVANGGGTMPAANVTNVDVTCVSSYTVGGRVSGLVGSGLTLAICTHAAGPGGGLTACSHPQQIGADGAFTLGSVDPAPPGVHRQVVIDQQPSSPPQQCVIGNAEVQNVDTSVTVACADYLAYFYVTNAADNTLSSYSVDATTGAAAVIGAPRTGASPYATVGFEFADKRYVFVGNKGDKSVSAFAVDPATGALTAVPGSPFPAGTDPQAMLVDNSFLSLFVANAGSDNVSAYAIDGNTGALTAEPGSPVAVGKSPTSIVVDPEGSQIYVANHGGSNDISEFGLGSPLTLKSSFSAGGNPLSLALGAQGRFLYSANPDASSPSISGFRVDPGTGALSPLSGSPFRLPVSHYMASDQTGAYLYVTWGASIVGYAIDATTGALTLLPGFPVAADVNAYSITIDPTNRILYVANDGAANVSGFTLDPSTGALTPMAGSPFPTGNHPQFISTF